MSPAVMLYGGTGSDLGNVFPLACSFAGLCDNPATLPVTRDGFREMPKEERDRIKRTRFVTPAVFPDAGKRVTERAVGFAVVAIDIDGGDRAPGLDAEGNVIGILSGLENFDHAVYRTASSTPEAPRLRVFVRVDGVLPPSLYRPAVNTVARRIGLPSVTKESYVMVQPMYLPTRFKGEPDEPVIVRHSTGRGLTEADLDTGNASAPAFTADTGNDRTDELDFLRPIVEGITLADAEDALRHLDPDMKMADWIETGCALKHQFNEEGFALWNEWSKQGEKYPGASEIRYRWDSLKANLRGRAPVTIRSLLSRAQLAGWDGGAAGLQIADYGTDVDASLRFAEAAARILRHCDGIGWLAWDGKRWASSGADQRAIEQSKTGARRWTNKANRSEEEGRPTRVKLAMTLEGAAHVKNAVDLAKSDPRLVVAVGDLDRDNMALNVSNGTLDLRTGKLRPHNRSDLITKLAPVVFISEARHVVLDHYLRGICEEIPDMANFLARVAGCALTGDASAESVFLIQGPGGNGKTTLLESIAAMLGDYAVKMEFSSLCASARHGGRGAGSASPDIVKLRGSRLAYASEGDQSARLDAGVVKLLSGGETITARALYSPPITFPQTWKLWLVSNYDPRCDADDSGLWRRLVKVPFPVLRGKADPTLKETLVNDPAARSALLAWAVRGCLDWQARGRGREGLGIPEQVQTATTAYRKEQDTTGAWFAELLADAAALDPKGETANRDLRGHYEQWCNENGASALSLPRFSLFLAERGLTKKTTKTGMVWKGIRFSSIP